jgi:hypothetical protein
MEEVKSLNMDKHVQVRNLCDWAIYFSLINTPGEVKMDANATRSMLVSEIIAQYNSNNVFFVGTELGKHARILIEDKETRDYLGIEGNILNDEKCDYILNLKTKKAFEDNINKDIVTSQEKDKIMNYARKHNFNDFDKITFLESHTSIKFKQEQKQE